LGGRLLRFARRDNWQVMISTTLNQCSSAGQDAFIAYQNLFFFKTIAVIL